MSNIENTVTKSLESVISEKKETPDHVFSENIYSEILGSSTMQKTQSVLDHIENLQN